MSLRLTGVAVALLLFAGHAEAGLFGGGDKLPKPISLIGLHIKHSNSAGLQAKHPPKQYSSPKWGTRWDLTFKDPVRPLKPSLKVQ